MAFASGKAGGFMIADASTTKRNIGTYLNSVGFPATIDTHDVTTFNTSGSAKVYVVGLVDHTISLEGKWDPTVDGYLSGLKGKGTKAFSYYPNTTASANTNFVRYSGSAILTSYEPPASVDDAVTFSAELQVSARVTRSTASS